MSKLHHRKFARFFPSYHPRAGKNTRFVEKIHWALPHDPRWQDAFEMIRDLNRHLPNEIVESFLDTIDDEQYYADISKHHTIRAGHHVKPGDFIRPSVWSGKPYRSKQIIIGPDIEVVNVWDFEFIHGSPISKHDVMAIVNGSITSIMDIAQNDGLTEDEFIQWFNKPFDGQIICWSKDVTY